MAKIDESFAFKPLRIATLTVSDTREKATDKSGDGRDVTPDAVKPLFEKEIEGFSVIFHMLSFQSVATSTIQSRACGGTANGTYVFCLPGSPGACKDAWNGILKWQLDSRHRPCNLVDIMPRLKEKRGH